MKNVILIVGLGALAFWAYKKYGKSSNTVKVGETKSEFLGTTASPIKQRNKVECFKTKGGGLRTLWSDGSVTNGC